MTAASTAATHLIIITGTSRGLGASLTQALLKPGNRLVCVSRSRNPELERAASASGVKVAWHLQDLSQAGPSATWLGSVLDVVEETLASVTLILNAGMIDPIGPIANLREPALVQHLLTNLATPMTMTAAFLSHTERFGCPRKILAISSGAARRPVEGWSAYCAGKAGLDMFVRSINAEYAQAPAERAVRAVALAPGVVDTGMQATIRNADFAQVQRFRDLKDNDQLASADDTARRIAAYLERPDFGSTELDDIRNT
ncbi:MULTISPECIES: SDR family oxidoreductase [Cupriavidus]|uniref:SDR family oxidoreductase n=1 Tax=Cupriavidus TaxID=106589 RepID=UPI0015FFCA29|nr:MULTISPECIES: SDR family oxidoreductase [Cupriavidus]MBB1634700.1 short-chain dehydrogenase [Cupriavidus sp. UME77]MCP3022260.1 SDR family oxidoreductase [Cupriavidus basilensis]MDR3379435.1 SDR family oxidoreductase [Cupriavidus basilensis]